MSRAERLGSALGKVRCSESLEEELGAWLGAAQRRLSAEEAAPIQGDAGVVDAMASEHAVSLDNKPLYPAINDVRGGPREVSTLGLRGCRINPMAPEEK